MGTARKRGLKGRVCCDRIYAMRLSTLWDHRPLPGRSVDGPN